MQPSLLDDASKTIFAVTSKESKFTAPYKQGEVQQMQLLLLSHFIWTERGDKGSTFELSVTSIWALPVH